MCHLSHRSAVALGWLMVMIVSAPGDAIAGDPNFNFDAYITLK